MGLGTQCRTRLYENLINDVCRASTFLGGAVFPFVRKVPVLLKALGVLQ